MDVQMIDSQERRAVAAIILGVVASGWWWSLCARIECGLARTDEKQARAQEILEQMSKRAE
jgi:hypothetical protein